MNTRAAAVAGMFYPDEPGELQAMVNRLLADNNPDEKSNRKTKPKVLVVPHAGYIYSGGMAAKAYNLLKPYAKTIRRVVLLGPSHRVALRGMALPSNDAFATPLGVIPLDTTTIDRLKDLPATGFLDAAHRQEHSLEVHLPFLQTVLESFTLVPVVVGDASPESVRALLEYLWDSDSNNDTLTVISTDLSHFLPYKDACATDKETIEHILSFDTSLAGEEACGCRPLNGLLLAARERELGIDFIGYCNSGDTAGNKDSVVGYAAFSLY